MPRRAMVDPRFATRLRQLRAQRGLSLRELAALTVHGKSYLSELEREVKRPTPEVARRLDDALQAGGELAGMVTMQNGLITPDDEDRLLHVARHPRRVDPATVDVLGELLAGQRRLEDMAGAAAVVRPVLAQLDAIDELVPEARGELRCRVVDVASQWAQFAGWLSAQARNPVAARQWYGRALEWSTEADNVDMIATALNMRGHLAWLAGQVGPLIAMSAAAARQPASSGVRALAVQQEARGHAMVGDEYRTDRLLDEAAGLAVAAAEQPADQPPWVYFFDSTFLQLQRGLAYRLLGRYTAAVEILTAGLSSVPDQTRESEWVGGYVCQLATAHAQVGDLVTATLVLAEADRIATATNSARLAGAVSRVRARFELSADR